MNGDNDICELRIPNTERCVLPNHAGRPALHGGSHRQNKTIQDCLRGLRDKLLQMDSTRVRFPWGDAWIPSKTPILCHCATFGHNSPPTSTPRVISRRIGVALSSALAADRQQIVIALLASSARHTLPRTDTGHEFTLNYDLRTSAGRMDARTAI